MQSSVSKGSVVEADVVSGYLFRMSNQKREGDSVKLTNECERNWSKPMACALLLVLILLSGAQAVAQPLQGTGTHLPIPSANPGRPDLIFPSITMTTNGFEGTWSAPAAPAWIGTFVATGSLPSSANSGTCLLYTSPSPRDLSTSRMPSSA